MRGELGTDPFGSAISELAHALPEALLNQRYVRAGLVPQSQTVDFARELGIVEGFLAKEGFRLDGVNRNEVRQYFESAGLVHKWYELTQVR